MNELISVIMSTYNEELTWVKASVDSILNQTYTEFELIIVVDNPKNSLLKGLLSEYEKKDKRIKVIQNKENMGLVKCLNVALEQCKGKYVARMDADDISTENRFSLQKNYLEKHDLDFVFTGVIYIDEQGNKLFEGNNHELNDLKTRKILEAGDIAAHPTWFSKKEMYVKLNGYREVPYCEDYDFLLRGLMQGYKMGKMNQMILFCRIRSNGITISNGLEQLLISRGLLRLYQTNKLDNFRNISKLIKTSRDSVSPKEKARYFAAEEKYKNGVRLIKKGCSFKGILEMITCLFISKYYILRYFDLCKYKIKQKLL